MERQSYKCKILYIIADSFEKRAFANGITLLKWKCNVNPFLEKEMSMPI